MGRIDMNFYESNKVFSGDMGKIFLINVRQIFEELEKESW